MQYISPYSLYDEFIYDEEFADKCNCHRKQFYGQKCYIDEVLFSPFEFTNLTIRTCDTQEYVGVGQLTNNDQFRYSDKSIPLQSEPLYLNEHDIIIDSFTKRWYKVQMVSFYKENSYVDYYFISSDDKQLIMSQDQLIFYVQNKIFEVIRYQ